MMEKITFKNWAEHNQYLLNNFEKSCVNCRYGFNGKVEDSQFVFCTEPKNGMLMANLGMGKVCNDWEKCD